MVNRQIEFDNDHTDGIKNFKVEKPTLIRFHASWCGHCKSMKNDWDKLKEMFKNDNVDIIDVEEGVLGVFPANLKENVNGFPTIKFFKNKNSSGVEYQGPRTLDALKDFVKENGVKMTGGQMTGGGSRFITKRKLKNRYNKFVKSKKVRKMRREFKKFSENTSRKLSKFAKRVSRKARAQSKKYRNKRKTRK